MTFDVITSTSSSDAMVEVDLGCVTILLVDDDRFTHELLELYLRGSEYRMISAFSAEEALKIVTISPPDMIIVDAILTGESGFSLIEKLKARPETASIPLLLWTMLTTADGSVMDASGKADILMNKPLCRADMSENLARAKAMAKNRRAIVKQNIDVVVEQSVDHIKVII